MQQRNKRSESTTQRLKRVGRREKRTSGGEERQMWELAHIDITCRSLSPPIGLKDGVGQDVGSRCKRPARGSNPLAP